MSHIVELHLHLDGSLRPETVWELAKEQGVELPAKSAEEVKYMMEVPEDCKTLEEYLERFDLPLLVLQKADAIERVFEIDELVVVEKYIQGTELTVAVLGNRDPFALPVIEIVPKADFMISNRNMPPAVRSISARHLSMRRKPSK